ncbi:MAG TPA: 1-acyl-sn-glycerol-3-phosphate acyltransferase [Flavisolibacter sp.]|nr:1-acyl-sn-glycerol-3-phosphate acyltransferase [Flavisolibacter sp.]
MFYPLLKIYARLAIRIYCRRIIVNRPELLISKGPLLIAANHPNSFLDGMILTTLLDQPLYSLARGDAFKQKGVNKILRKLQLLPVYRSSEGTENLEHNYTTFAACQQTFKAGGVVLIFSEGKCENEWHLRPLKKGTARLAVTAWKQSVALPVLPLGFNYSSFKQFGKEVHLNFGQPITPGQLPPLKSEAKQLLYFNQLLQNQLKQLVYEIDPQDELKQQSIFHVSIHPSFWLLAVPAFAGWLLHAPLFYPVKIIAKLWFGRSVHYDSVVTSLLLIIYPFYLIILTFGLFQLFSWYSLIALPLLPFTALACVQAKYQLGI